MVSLVTGIAESLYIVNGAKPNVMPIAPMMASQPFLRSADYAAVAVPFKSLLTKNLPMCRLKVPVISCLSLAHLISKSRSEGASEAEYP